MIPSAIAQRNELRYGSHAMASSANYIRPPNEQNSTIVRAVYGCSWNRCRFCGIYAAMGVEAQDLSAPQILAEIADARERRGARSKTVFIGDADPMRIPADEFVTVLESVKSAFPESTRVTCYGRLATAWLRRKHLARFRAAGLTRIHAGLETGSEQLLRFHKKGISSRRAAEASRAIREAGIELSLYVLLGIGGSTHEDEHVHETTRVLDEAHPEFVRFRRLWIHDACPLIHEVRHGTFAPQSPEGTVRESRGIVARLAFPCKLEALHSNVYCPFTGRLPEKRNAILDRIDRFLRLPENEKALAYGRADVI
jgi:biotin synthase-like enzyme